ncbi:tRNA lysidine(34) synthetase TilS [Tenacibaculum sp. SG-28]|uniref:tRNA lysidine(34) synthetase TilS n=1 Tax=Tenacibaculum sp. SG-28 TaxID=754426 RepID=UPI001E41A6E9|nr:tRNA lysidine(34) synthetase TilS [Tenacibaculum sp. SG-28]
MKDKKLLVAISGGMDSVVLTHLLHGLGYAISLAHCNFQLRDQASDLDEKFVVSLGEKLQIPKYTIQFDTVKYCKKNKVSTQIGARELRYTWFSELLALHGLDYVVTAHHANDNLETFLINLTRGTGLDGLSGIPALNGNIVRPLLFFSREQIKNYALSYDLSWREDASNTDTKYLRNKIRHTIIPILQEMNPSMLQSFTKSLYFIEQSKQIIKDRIEEVEPSIISRNADSISFKISALKKLSDPSAYLYQFLKGYGFKEWNDVYNLMNATTGKFLKTKSHTLLKDRDFLLLLPTHKLYSNDSQVFKITESDVVVEEPIRLMVKNVQKLASLSKNTIYVDKNLLNYPLSIRKWSDGDYFFPKGMLGKKRSISI